MNRKFACKTIPSTWLEIEGRRLDCGPYMSGAIEAREIIKHLHTEELRTLTSGHKGGIYNGSPFVRNYVDDPEYGVPFLTTSSLLQADLNNISFLSKKDATSSKLSFLEVKEKMTLITCSGSIGRMAYARKDMEGCWSNQDILKVVPDEDKIKSGYLFAYLGSRFGVPLVISGTYGAIIQHIEPHHIAELPVPRLGEVEEHVHELVQQAADLRTKAISLLKEASSKVNDQLGFPEKLALSHRNFSCSVASSNDVLSRLEATYHDVIAQESDRLIAGIIRKDELASLGITINETGRLKQVFVDEEYGVPFLTSGEIFRLRYEPVRFLSKRLLPDDDEWETQEGDLLLARSGQVGGIIGRGVWADRRYATGSVSVDVVRIGAQDSQILPGYLYAYLFLTDVGYRQLVRTAAGSSIPHLSVPDVLRLMIPRCDQDFEADINRLVWDAGNMRADAQEREDEARTLVERAIEEGGR